MPKENSLCDETDQRVTNDMKMQQLRHNKGERFSDEKRRKREDSKLETEKERERNTTVGGETLTTTLTTGNSNREVILHGAH